MLISEIKTKNATSIKPLGSTSVTLLPDHIKTTYHTWKEEPHTDIPKIPTYSQNTQREVDSVEITVANSLYFSAE